jgi:hypothetical protein
MSRFRVCLYAQTLPTVIFLQPTIMCSLKQNVAIEGYYQTKLFLIIAKYAYRIAKLQAPEIIITTLAFVPKSGINISAFDFMFPAVLHKTGRQFVKHSFCEDFVTLTQIFVTIGATNQGSKLRLLTKQADRIKLVLKIEVSRLIMWTGIACKGNWLRRREY